MAMLGVDDKQTIGEVTTEVSWRGLKVDSRLVLFSIR